jgi:hypothetical protein
MNAKQKALEIYNKFRNENSVMTANVRAKKQAIICIDEIMEAHNTYYDTIGENLARIKYAFWKDVKTELEALS